MKKLIHILKTQKNNLLINFTFIITYLLIIMIKSRMGKYALASTTDFSTQHYIIPEYFRMLFYKTHDLLPDFALNLSGGENIYYLSYYGLLNPLFMFSYFFPNISMLNYTIFIMGVVVVSSTSLFYFYLRRNNYSYLISFLSAFMLLCSSPFIFHSNRHIMFIDYMPFLIIGFSGIDLFINKNKSYLLIISIVLMIFTSYYFSVSGILVLLVLGIYKYLKNNNLNIKQLSKKVISLLIIIVISILISSIIIFPTLYTLLVGRDGNSSFLKLTELIKPNMYLLYSHYSMGLTLISLVSVIYMIKKKDKANNFLAILLLIVSICPIPTFILNGLLYASSKVLIPFIPLVLILVSEFLVICFKKAYLKKFLTIYLIIIPLILCIYINSKEELVLKEDLSKYPQYINEINDNGFYRINSSLYNEKYINTVENINEYKTTSYSSVHNKNYKKFYVNTFDNPLRYRNEFMLSSSNDILFQIYMGEKYIITKNKYNNFYEKVKETNNYNIYKNNYVLPIGYATSNIINEKEFNKLSSFDRDFNLLGNIITNEKTSKKIIKLDKIDLDYNVESINGIKYKKIKNGYKVSVKDKGKIKLKLNSDLSNKILFINFDLNDSKKTDLSIKINNIENKLTCKTWKYYNDNNKFSYQLLSNDKNTLTIKLKKGKYVIKNINVNVVDMDMIKNIRNEVDEYVIDKNKTKGDVIDGNINVKKDSYFTISIPYDKGFSIYVDNKKVKYKKVNKAFLGFKIQEGKHNIKIVFNAPYKRVSIIISIVGLLLGSIICLREKNKK